MPGTVVVDSGVGNLGSVLNMLRRIGAEATVAGNAAAVREADRVILPGVGSFDAAMSRIDGIHGLRDALEHAAHVRRVPFLGICLGMQVLLEGSDEGSARGLGWIPGRVVAFDRSRLERGEKVPHMGWNAVTAAADSPLFPASGQSRFYFVHSYHAVPANPDHTDAWAIHGYRFACAVRSGNVCGVQFHPEKSNRHGMALLHAFVSWEGR